MAEQHQEPKSGRFQQWREKRRAKGERARGIHQRAKQARAERSKRAGAGAGMGGQMPPGGMM